MADHSDYKPGNMDIRVQEKTFDNFMWFVSRGAVLVICILIFMAIVNG
ncbi:aa3-type cytochrome c oxidase subunit IV [Paragemmobacter straminiformis]|uniref:Aa3-type cytochrome c oxidase subunit IV n=1 Tax=Paragemmobacter straminiformis TaxID=2045119 RepID=A0A842I6Y0_9RHOB|nr:aa3-type cytochrome c oxidase subunit IV [Gemmobacter straminiformis]MBC2834718.1 aa3-type cytochrome c oxidase subunit IV [Gemmobacter straminiformis]